MSTLLYIESSPRKARSHSVGVAEAFLDAYSAAHPDDTIERLDLWAEDLMPFDGDALDAKYAVLHGQDPTDAQKAAWGKVTAEFERFAAADKYLLSLPMWNFGVPYVLKHYIDVITQPGLAFTVSPEGAYQGLVTGKPAAVVYARGGAYPPGSPGEAIDFQKRYMDHWLGFIGFTDVRPILVEPTLASPDDSGAAIAAARQSAESIARDF